MREPAPVAAAASDALTLTRPVVVIGPMAVGKSAVGAEVARRNGVQFLDTDQLITARYGTIADIFSSRGEHYFREVEARTVAETLEKYRGRALVLSLGGGAVLDSGTQQWLAGATVIYMDTDLTTVLPRIRRPGARPLLAEDPVEAWERLAAVRRPVYERLADHVVDARGGNITTVVERLEAALRKESNS